MITVAITYSFILSFIFMNYKIKLAEFLLGANILQVASGNTNMNSLQSTERLKLLRNTDQL